MINSIFLLKAVNRNKSKSMKIGDIVDEDAIDQVDELGPGTTEGLTGAVKEDRSICTVGDLWRRLSGSEDEKKRKR